MSSVEGDGRLWTSGTSSRSLLWPVKRARPTMTGVPGCIMTISRLGDQAVWAAFASEAEALRFTAAVRAAMPAGVVDVVAAYFCVAVFYDLACTRYSQLAPTLQRL